MKYFSLTLLSLFSCFAHSQYQDMNEADMQRMVNSMMEGAQQMQACISKVDQGAIEVLMKEGESLQQQVTQLCDAGDKSKAQDVAVAYVEKMQSHTEIKKLMNCGEMAQQLLGDMPYQQWSTEMGNTTESRHVCDSNK